MNRACDFARRSVWAAFWLKRAGLAVLLASEVDHRAFLRQAVAWLGESAVVFPQLFAAGADIEVVFGVKDGVKDKVAARKGSVRPLGLSMGAVIGTSSDATAISHSLQEVVWSGAFVGTVMPPPATLLVNAPQYATGKVLTDAAIGCLNAKLRGKARVVLLTQDTLQYLSPRFQAMRDGLDKLPGATIVADIAPRPISEEGGFATMNTILLANPNIDVVPGADAVVLGALKALRAVGIDRPDQFLGGIRRRARGGVRDQKGL